MDINEEAIPEIEPGGLDYWMDGVIRECDHLRCNFAPVPVHDLRVTLRRCRSIADGFMGFDPHPAWKLMKSESRKLFRQLGALRDTQVMMEWIQRLAPDPDEASHILREYLEGQEAEQKESAAKAVLDFDYKKWASWRRMLTGRARRIPLESLVFQHLALERLFEARERHRRALRNRSPVEYHRLRIALKKFRYTLENFLPSRHERWGPELKELQDLLGEMHDLYVLWRTAVAIRAVHNVETRLRWRRLILEESSRRLQKYRDRMLGKTSLLLVWFSELPHSDQVKDAAFARFKIWASYRDPDIYHSEHVARLVLQLYDGLEPLQLAPLNVLPDARRILEAAALAHAAGAGKMAKKPQVTACRLIRKLSPPLGLSAETMQMIALVVRFHRGSLPRPDQKALSGLSEEQRKVVVLMSGILRLSDAFDRLQGRRIYRLELKRSGDILYITAPGYTETGASAEKLSAARHLLEVACRLPILFR
jgi:CHAD domain-containing protein